MEPNIKDLFEQILSSHQQPIKDAWLDEEFKKKSNRQRHKQRGFLYWLVMALLGLEVVAMFLIVISQGIQSVVFIGVPFNLEEWVLGIFSSGVLLQTFGLAKIITEHLFPIPKNE